MRLAAMREAVSRWWRVFIGVSPVGRLGFKHSSRPGASGFNLGSVYFRAGLAGRYGQGGAVVRDGLQGIHQMGVFGRQRLAGREQDPCVPLRPPPPAIMSLVARNAPARFTMKF